MVGWGVVRGKRGTRRFLRWPKWKLLNCRVVRKGYGGKCRVQLRVGLSRNVCVSELIGGCVIKGRYSSKQSKSGLALALHTQTHPQAGPGLAVHTHKLSQAQLHTHTYHGPGLTSHVVAERVRVRPIKASLAVLSNTRARPTSPSYIKKLAWIK